jgi:hypothetical protein
MAIRTILKTGNALDPLCGPLFLTDARDVIEQAVICQRWRLTLQLTTKSNSRFGSGAAFLMTRITICVPQLPTFGRYRLSFPHITDGSA